MAAENELHGCPLLERIGEGGIADVFRSEWGGRPVALKVLRDTDRISMRNRFLREGRLLQRLDHPGLVRCLSVFDGESPALVLELLIGQPLDERIAAAPLGGEQAMHLAATVLRVLQHLHDLGVVHRDVKASNIFCGVDNRIVLMDLGLATSSGDLVNTTLGDVLGTYAYMAPEQIAGAGSDHRCDLYSLGVTLYEALCGARPYSAGGAAGWLAAHRSGAATPLMEVASGIPVRLAALVDRLMARDPSARPASAAVALAMLTGATGVRRELCRPTLVGREAVRGAIEAVVDAKGWVIVTGPSGSGVGPMAHLARTLAADVHMEVIGLRGRPRLTGQDVLQHLGHELTRFGMPQASDADHLVELLGELAEEGGLMLLGEDVDAFGEEARALLDRVSAIPKLSVVHLGVNLDPRPGSRHLVLRPLDLLETRMVLQAMLDSPSVPEGLDAALFSASGGLAGHAVTLVREQVSEGTLWCDGVMEDGQPWWRWAAAAGIAVGDGSRRHLARVIAGVHPAARLALELLVVADDAMPLSLLLDLVGGDRSGIELLPLTRQGVVQVSVEGGEEWISFHRHAIERVLAEAMPPERRAVLHLVLSEGVSIRPSGEWETRFATLHRAFGERSPSAFAGWVELGESLAHAGRPLTALRLLDRVETSADFPEEWMARRAIARATALRTAGRLAESRDALAAGSSLLPDEGMAEPRRRIQALELELAVALGTQPSERLVENVGKRREEGRPEDLLALGELAKIRGQLTTAESLLDAARKAATASDRVWVRAGISQAHVWMLAGRTGAAVRLLMGVVRALKGRDRRTPLAEAYLVLGRVHRHRGQFGRALEFAALAAEAQGRRDVRAHSVYVSVLNAWVFLGAGDLGASEAGLARVAGSTGTGLPYEVRAFYFEVLADLRRAQDDGLSALAAHLAGLDAARAADDPIRAYFHDGMAGLLTGNARLVSAAVGRLGEIAAPRYLAWLYLVGGIAAGDSTVLEAAEEEARKSEDSVLLLDVFHASKLDSRRREARSLARALLEASVGPLHESVSRLPAVRWALGEPERPSRDRGG